MSTPDLDASVRILTNASAVVLDLTEANGYYLVEVSTPDRTWRRITVHSPYADGEFPVAMVLEGGMHGFICRIDGSSQAQINTRRQALVDAVEVWSWLLEVTIGNSRSVWRATRGDSSFPLDKYMAMAGQSTYIAKVPVQPTAAFTTI
jgi:hypothetical protein